MEGKRSCEKSLFERTLRKSKCKGTNIEGSMKAKIQQVRNALKKLHLLRPKSSGEWARRIDFCFVSGAAPPAPPVALLAPAKDDYAARRVHLRAAGRAHSSSLLSLRPGFASF